jgi:hypothetical protein
MARDANNDLDSDVEHTTFTLDPDSKIAAEYPSSDNVSKEIIKAGNNDRDAFVGGGSLEAYEPIPEYEGRHRHDPKAQWTEEEEKKLVRKLDYRICSWVCLMFFGEQHSIFVHTYSLTSFQRFNLIEATSRKLSPTTY